MSSRQRINAYLSGIITVGIALILVVMPFHAFISVVSGSYNSAISLVGGWKEILIVALAGCALLWTINNRRLPIQLDVVNWTALGFIAVAVIASLFSSQSHRAMLYGFKADCMMLVLFLLAQMKLPYFTRQRLAQLLLIPAIVVAALAVSQSVFLPINFLTRIGYGPDTINPLQIVDGSLGLMRAFSTLGGPNQLGAYMILPISLSIALLVVKRKYIVAAALPLFGAALVLSYSRSAWIGAVVAIFLVILLSIPAKFRLAYILVAGLLTVMAVVSVARVVGSDQVTKLQHVLLHGRNFEDQVQGSDQNRISSMGQAVSDMIHRPIGYGLGSAGPASIRSGETRVTENWYLQIGLETGLLGLFLIVSLLLFLFYENSVFTWGSADYMSFALAATLAGVMVCGLFLHSLADSTLAYVLMAALGINRRLTK